MKQEHPPEIGARTRLFNFLNMELVKPESLKQYREALPLLFEDLKLEVAREMAQIKDILDVETYGQVLHSQLYHGIFPFLKKIDKCEELEADPSSLGLNLLLRNEGILAFDPDELSLHPERSVELAKIGNYVNQFCDEIPGYFIVMTVDTIRSIIAARRTDILDDRLDRHYEFAFYERLSASRPIRNEEELRAFETFRLLERYIFLNFGCEIDTNFRSYKSDISKAYLEFLQIQLQEFQKESRTVKMELPAPDSPLYFKALSLLSYRRKQHDKWFRKLEKQIAEKKEYQKTHFFPRDVSECQPGTLKDEMMFHWLKDLFKYDSVRRHVRAMFLSNQEFEDMLALVNNPREWGPEEHETVLRLKEYNAMCKVESRPWVFLKDFYKQEGLEEIFMGG